MGSNNETTPKPSGEIYYRNHSKLRRLATTVVIPALIGTSCASGTPTETVEVVETEEVKHQPTIYPLNIGGPGSEASLLQPPEDELQAQPTPTAVSVIEGYLDVFRSQQAKLEEHFSSGVTWKEDSEVIMVLFYPSTQEIQPRVGAYILSGGATDDSTNVEYTPDLILFHDDEGNLTALSANTVRIATQEGTHVETETETLESNYQQIDDIINALNTDLQNYASNGTKAEIKRNNDILQLYVTESKDSDRTLAIPIGRLQLSEQGNILVTRPITATEVGEQTVSFTLGALVVSPDQGLILTGGSPTVIPTVIWEKEPVETVEEVEPSPTPVDEVEPSPTPVDEVEPSPTPESHNPIPVESLFKYHTAWPKILDAIGAETGVKVEFFAAPSSHAVQGDEVGFFPWDPEKGVQSQETRPDLLADLIYNWFETVVTKANPDGSFWAMNASEIQQWIEEGGLGGVTARDGRAPDRSKMLEQHNVKDVTRIMLVHQGFEKPASGQRQPVEAGSVPLDATGSGSEPLFLKLPINAGQDYNTGFQLLEVAIFPNEDKNNTGKTLVVFFNGIALPKIGKYAEAEIGSDGGWTPSFLISLVNGFLISSQNPSQQLDMSSLQREALEKLSGEGFVSTSEASSQFFSHLVSPFYQKTYYNNQPPMIQIRPVDYP